MAHNSSRIDGDTFTATEKWQALCDVYKIPLADVSNQLQVLAGKLSLPATSPVWDQIIFALSNRNRNNLSAQAAMNDLKNLTDNSVLTNITEAMRNLQGKFIAMFATQDFKPSTYHFYGHGKEMSEDPGNLIKNVVVADEVGNFLTATINALGAAHDIIQNAGAPFNERDSAEIFETQTSQMINEIIERNNFDPETLAVLVNLRDRAMPFLAEECIVNGTYLLFNSDKRDFDNVLTQISQVLEEAKGKVPETMQLSREVLAMKTAISLADTRRSEIKSVLKKHESLSTILAADKQNTVKLLQTAGLLKPNETLPDLATTNKNEQEKLMKIEGFLLRLGQNIRMTSELAVHFAQNSEQQQIIRDIRSNKPYQITVESHLDPFLKAIEGPYGEAAFAKSLGIINNSELPMQISKNQLETMVNPDNFDFNGWARHADDLVTMKNNLATMSPEDKNAITNIIYITAAKSPGHRVGQDTFDAMVRFRKELYFTNPKLVTNLDKNLKEVIAANPKLIRHNVVIGYNTPIKSNFMLFSGPRYSEPNMQQTLSATTTPVVKQRKLAKDAMDNGPKTTRAPASPKAQFEIVTKETRRNSSTEYSKDSLPSIHKLSKHSSMTHATTQSKKSTVKENKSDANSLPPIHRRKR